MSSSPKCKIQEKCDVTIAVAMVTNRRGWFECYQMYKISQRWTVIQAWKITDMCIVPIQNFCQTTFSKFCFVDFLWIFSWTLRIFLQNFMVKWTLTLNNGQTETVIKKVVWQKFYNSMLHMPPTVHAGRAVGRWEILYIWKYPDLKTERGENSL